ICPMPEATRARGREAAFIPGRLLTTDATAALRQQFGKPGDKGRWVAGATEPWVYLNHALIKERGLQSATVEAALADWFRRQPGIQAVYTRTQLLGEASPGDPVEASVRRSFQPDRCGDLAVILKPY